MARGTAEMAQPDDQRIEAMLRRAYEAFNARDIDGALSLMHPDVEWPNGMGGGYVHGHREVRDYWTRQWTIIDPSVTPEAFELEPDGRTAIEVHQVIKDLSGNILADQTVWHVYKVEGGLIRHMEIRPDGPA
jgi:ketosteroid isomerase-like protein